MSNSRLNPTRYLHQTLEASQVTKNGLKFRPAPALFGRAMLVMVILLSLVMVTPVSAQVPPSTTSLTFGPQAVGTTSAPQTATFVAQNTLTITSITASGDFGQTNNCVTGTLVRFGYSCNIQVTFTPTAGGTRTGNITINWMLVTGGPGSTVISLTGTGIGTVTLGSIRGKVTFQGQPLPGPAGGVRLNGGSRQQTDANGNFGYDNLQPGNYTVTVDYDPKTYVVNGNASITVNVAAGSTVSNVNFDLLPLTATTTAAPTSSNTPAPSTTPAPTAATTPVTTALAAPNPNCVATSPIDEQLDLVVCLQSVILPGAPGNNIRYVLNLKVNNGFENAVSLANSVEVSVAPGVTVVSTQSDVGNTRTDTTNRQLVWNGFTVPAKGGAGLVVTLEAAPSSASQPGTPLLNSILMTAVNTATGERYEGRVGVVSIGGGLVRNAAQTVPSALPRTGTGKVEDNLALNLTGFGLLGLALLVMGTFYLGRRARSGRR